MGECACTAAQGFCNMVQANPQAPGHEHAGVWFIGLSSPLVRTGCPPTPCGVCRPGEQFAGTSVLTPWNAAEATSLSNARCHCIACPCSTTPSAKLPEHPLKSPSSKRVPFHDKMRQTCGSLAPARCETEVTSRPVFHPSVPQDSVHHAIPLVLQTLGANWANAWKQAPQCEGS